MKTCSLCKQSFEIIERDREFYKKIAVPEPTHCPSCRMQRRFSFRNERNLYHRQCNLTGKQIISMYHPSSPFPVYDQSAWWSDDWDATQYGQEIDFNRPFFAQYYELQQKVPRIALLNVNQENSEYCNFTGDVKNSYLIFGSVYCEDCYYGSPYYSKHCIDTLVVRKCEWCYECTDCRGLYQGMYCQDCTDSDHLIFCYDLKGCSECIGCVGLRNKKYHIFNQPFSEKEYFTKKKELNLCDPRQVALIRQKLSELKLTIPRRFMQANNVQKVSGDHIYESKNTFYSFFADRCEDCSYCAQVVDLKDCYDNNYTEENELCYEYLGMYAVRRTLFSLFCRHTNQVLYSDHCISSEHLFGCISLRNKQHYILNKQYSQKEYETLIPQIIEHMKKTQEWGEFFPIQYSPFTYSESVAQEYFPLNKTEEDSPTRDQKKSRYKIPQDIRKVEDDILESILICEVTAKTYKIIRQELEFYRRMNLPIPRRCPDQRHLDRMQLRNPRHLWERNCSKCDATMQSTYSPDRPEKVYCDRCYLSEVYSSESP